MAIVGDLGSFKQRDRIERICDDCNISQMMNAGSLQRRGNTHICHACVLVRRNKANIGKPTGPISIEARLARCGEKNNFFGKKHTKESMDRAAKSRSANPVWLPNMLDGIKNRKKPCQKGKKCSRPKRTKWIIGDIMFRSSWEYGFARYLTDSGKSWEYESLEYKLSDGRAYHPDFYSEGIVYEIKGADLKGESEKFYMAQREYPDVSFVIYFHQDLKDMKILTKSNNKLICLQGDKYPPGHEEAYEEYKKLKGFE